MLRRILGPSAICIALLAPSFALAAGNDDANAAAAEALFQEGRKLMDGKKYAEACTKFAASHKVAPAIGTLLNLADCYEKNNQIATAWQRFHDAVSLAQQLKRANREQTARERAEKLEPRLIRLTIKASGVDVKLDGNAIDAAVLGTPIPVDSGKHTVEASAKGKKAFTKELELTEKNKAPSVEIPPLEDDAPHGSILGDPKETKEAKDPKDGKDPVSEPPKEPKAGWPAQKTIGLVAAGVGVVGIGVGLYFGINTASTWKQARAFCDGLDCTKDGVDLAADAQSSGNISTIAVIGGSVLLVGGLVLFFTAPRKKTATLTGGAVQSAARPSLDLGVGPGSLVFHGAF
jgi:hypothetical protein